MSEIENPDPSNKNEIKEESAKNEIKMNDNKKR